MKVVPTCSDLGAPKKMLPTVQVLRSKAEEARRSLLGRAAR
jgi:hypothetical protein